MGVREPAASDPTHGGGVLKVMGSEAGREAAGVGSADQSRAGELAAPRRLAGGDHIHDVLAMHRDIQDRLAAQRHTAGCLAGSGHRANVLAGAGCTQDAWQGLGTQQTSWQGLGAQQVGWHSRATWLPQPKVGQQTAGQASWQELGTQQADWQLAGQLVSHMVVWGWEGLGQRTGLVWRLPPQGAPYTQAVVSWQ